MRQMTPSKMHCTQCVICGLTIHCSADSLSVWNISCIFSLTLRRSPLRCETLQLCNIHGDFPWISPTTGASLTLSNPPNFIREYTTWIKQRVRVTGSLHAMFIPASPFVKLPAGLRSSCFEQKMLLPPFLLVTDWQSTARRS